MTLANDPSLDVGAAGLRVDVLRRRARDLAIAAALMTAAGVPFFVLGHDAAGFACVVGAAAGLAVRELARAERGQLLTRLVAAGADAVHRDVAVFSATLVSEARRARLARGLEVAASAGKQGLHEYTHVRPDRAYDVRGDLLRLAGAFRDPAQPVAPRSAALCRRMLCEASVSPLYNPQIFEAELRGLLSEIEAGFDLER